MYYGAGRALYTPHIHLNMSSSNHVHFHVYPDLTAFYGSVCVVRVNIYTGLSWVYTSPVPLSTQFCPSEHHFPCKTSIVYSILIYTSSLYKPSHDCDCTVALVLALAVALR